MSVLYKTAYVRSRIVDGLAVVLDLRSGEYVILDRVATAMWRALLTVEEHERIPLLRSRFDVHAERLTADLDAFARNCIERGFLDERTPEPAERPRTRTAVRGVLTLRAWWSMLYTTRALAMRGFAWTYERYARIAKPIGGRDDEAELLQHAERAFSRAENFFVMHAAPKDCLPRSLALYRFLLSVGIPADHCIGVRRFPFEAHAWVECGEHVLYDSESRVHLYAELARI
jgi:transglutaminase superfamily protein/coenzyme PQQ synthesis protein D (PqqD)